MADAALSDEAIIGREDRGVWADRFVCSGRLLRRHVLEAEALIRFVVTVENLGRQIEPVRPHDGASVRVDTNLGEVRRIIEPAVGADRCSNQRATPWSRMYM